MRMTKEEIKRILSENSEVLRRYKVKFLALFGSYVRNEQREGSDIDLLVEFEETTFDNYIGLLFSLEEILGVKVDLLTRGMVSPYIEPYILREIDYIEGC